MNAATFLSELRRREIQVSAVGGQLHCTAKAGALTPELRDQLREWKNDILKVLASAQEYVDAHPPVAEAPTEMEFTPEMEPTDHAAPAYPMVVEMKLPAMTTPNGLVGLWRKSG